MNSWADRNHAGTALFLLLTLIDVAWLHSHLVSLMAFVLGLISIPTPAANGRRGTRVRRGGHAGLADRARVASPPQMRTRDPCVILISYCARIRRGQARLSIWRIAYRLAEECGRQKRREWQRSHDSVLRAFAAGVGSCCRLRRKGALGERFLLETIQFRSGDERAPTRLVCVDFPLADQIVEEGASDRIFTAKLFDGEKARGW